MSDIEAQLRTALASRYTIERELGRGGMATVYLAEDLKHHRHVAIKVLDPELARALGSERFLREVEVTAKLTHPHILTLIDSGEADGFLYYVMPYIEGETLRDRMNREGQLPLDDALQVTKEVAAALSYAHSHDVVHRDIKPENVLLSAGEAVVVDFGIARAITEAGGEQLTETGISIGTPAYMSPEQASGAQKLDGRSDVYSLGCVLYEMLAGEPPYTGPTAQAVLAKKLSESTPRVSVIRERVPSGIEAAIDQALAKAPADRFATAEQFVEALSAERGSAPQTPSAVTRLITRRNAVIGVAVVVLVAAAIVFGRRDDATGFPRTAIAVLPFVNLSGEEAHGHIAPGLHSELLTQLQAVGELEPRGRTSVMGYAETTRPPAQVAQELAVGSIVEAEVQVVSDRVVVNVRLIDTATEEQIWAHRYDDVLDDLLAVQNDIAQQIVMAIGAVLTEAEASALVAVPTQNAQAYRLYLQGMDYYHRPGKVRRNYEIAQGLFERAVALDSTFALAHAVLSEVHGGMFFHRYDPTPERLMDQHNAAQTALRLEPTLARAHLAMGLVHYQGHRDWQAALEELHIALEGLPNDAELWMRIGYAQRRLGNWAEVLTAFDKVVALDPRNVDALSDLGGHTFNVLQRYPEAVEWYTRSLALAPDAAGKDIFRGWIWVKWHGWLDSLAAALDRHSPEANVGASGTVSAWRALTLFWERKPDSLLALLRQAAQPVFDGQEFYLPKALYSAWAHQLEARTVAAQAAFDSAQVMLDSVVRELPEDWRVHAARGLTLAGLGRKQEALREAQWIHQSASYEEEPMEGMGVVEARAHILVQAGQTDVALDLIERLLEAPAFFFSVHTLRLNPLFDPIRDDPRFQALLERYKN